MILHDVCTVTWTEVLDKLSPGGTPRVVVAGQIPCEINPIETEPPTDSSLIKIRYRFVTNIDLTLLADAQEAEWRANPGGRNISGIRLTLTYDGKTISPEAGFERHKILGRFHHIESVMKDFGFTGS